MICRPKIVVWSPVLHSSLDDIVYSNLGGSVTPLLIARTTTATRLLATSASKFPLVAKLQIVKCNYYASKLLKLQNAKLQNYKIAALEHWSIELQVWVEHLWIWEEIGGVLKREGLHKYWKDHHLHHRNLYVILIDILREKAVQRGQDLWLHPRILWEALVVQQEQRLPEQSGSLFLKQRKGAHFVLLWYGINDTVLMIQYQWYGINDTISMIPDILQDCENSLGMCEGKKCACKNIKNISEWVWFIHV